MPTRKHARGYLLTEALVSAGVLTIMLAASMSYIGTARQEAGYAAMKASATHYARTKADELVSGDMPASITPLTVFAAVPYDTRLEWRWSVAQSGLQASSTPNLVNANTLLEVVVDVRYPVRGGTRTTTYRRLWRERK